jgi:hypothetical protein
MDHLISAKWTTRRNLAVSCPHYQPQLSVNHWINSSGCQYPVIELPLKWNYLIHLSGRQFLLLMAAAAAAENNHLINFNGCQFIR